MSLARSLLAADHEVALIDRDVDRCASLEDELGSILIAGDGTEAGILARAGANRADVFIATTSRDDDNLVACQVARHRFGAKQAISLVNIPEHEALFGRLGVDAVVNTTELIVVRIQQQFGTLLEEEDMG